MHTVDLGAQEAVNVSDAVARGRAILAALDGHMVVMLDTSETDGSETTWNEMVAYLARRGVTVKYDHELGYSVAVYRL
jgi:hypothetical protein